MVLLKLHAHLVVLVIFVAYVIAVTFTTAAAAAAAAKDEKAIHVSMKHTETIPEPPCDGCTPVFYPGLNNSQCYRIPTIIQTTKGTLLAFSEERGLSCSDNDNEHNLVLRRSQDGGTTWGPLILVVKGSDFPPACRFCKATVSNPNPVEVPHPESDEKTRILLTFDTMNNPSERKHGSDMFAYSDDQGLTWTVVGDIEYSPRENNGCLIGPTVGIRSERTGKVYFSIHDFDSTHFLFWTVDGGENWEASPDIVKGVDECSLAFLPESLMSVHLDQDLILMNCRTANHGRAQALWNQDGKIVANLTYPDGLIDSNCQGSIATDEDSSSIFLSNTNSTTKRTNMTIKRSRDGGLSWNHGYLVHSGPSAYSQLVILKNDTTRDSSSKDTDNESASVEVGLLFEVGTETSYDTISFYRHTFPM